jgi:hypothetical protein
MAKLPTILRTDKPPLEHLQMHIQEQVTFINAYVCEHSDDEAVSTPTPGTAHISARVHDSLLLLFCQYPVYPAVNARASKTGKVIYTKIIYTTKNRLLLKIKRIGRNVVVVVLVEDVVVSFCA